MATVPCVLVLDDDEILRSLLEALLSAEGYRLTLADRPAAALASLQGDISFNLILTDLNLPGTDAETLAHTLREALPANAVLLAMSGTTPPPHIAALFDGFLLKPFDVAALEEAERQARQHRTTAFSPAVDAAGSDPAVTILDENIFRSLAAAIPLARLGELYEMTITDVLSRHTRMEDAARAGDLVRLKEEAHTTKGSCGMVGALELQKLAAEVEGGTTVNTPSIAEIPAACQRLRGMLRAKLK